MKKKEAKANAILYANDMPIQEVKAIEVEKSRKSSLKQQQRDKCIESFHCPILGCQKSFDKHKRKKFTWITGEFFFFIQPRNDPKISRTFYRLLSHVEKRHTLKQYLIFVTHHEFFDYLDSKCSQCGKIYNGKHTDSNCARMLDLIEQNKISNLEIRKILSAMIKVPVTSSPVPEPSTTKSRRRSRKRSQLLEKPRDWSYDFCESEDENSNHRLWLDFQKPFNFGNTIYHRCPAIDCNYQALKNCDDSDDNREIMAHLREKHPIEFIVLKQTKFPKSTVQCGQCNFWFRSGRVPC